MAAAASPDFSLSVELCRPVNYHHRIAMAMPEEIKRKRALVRKLDKLLQKEHGDKVPPPGGTDPLDELVLTVLSQNTNDKNRDRAYNELRKRFPAWENVMDARPLDIEDAIRVGGLAKQKSERIKAMLAEIKRREGKLDLGRICEMPRDEALAYLYSFKGVAEKTAAIVMLFSCGEPVFPVDTHIFRVSKRLGLMPEKDDAKKAHKAMGELVPDNIMYRFHINLIEHGRAICSPAKPKCGECCLSRECPSAGSFGPDKNKTA